MRWRIWVLFIVLSISYSGLFLNVYNLQIRKGDYYLKKAGAQQRASGTLEARRGNIYFTDKNNNLIPAALNKEYPMIYAVPKDIDDPETSAISLSGIVNKTEKTLIEYFSKPNDSYELLVSKADSQQINQVEELDLRGIYINTHLLRFYPFGNLASHLIGFVAPVDETLMGRYGVEFYLDDDLGGKSGRIDGRETVKPEDGKEIVLTIDRNIQSRAEEILGELIKKYKAEKGTVIVQEPKSGKILAMGNFPTFDPNNYSQFDISSFLNPATQAVYEPGSVFKLITMAAGIDSGKITPQTTYVDTGSVVLNGKTIKNWDLKAHGEQTMTGVIEQSLNTGAVFAQRQMGSDIFYNYLIKFGLNELTGLSLPGEVRSNIRNLLNGRDIDFATASFGQGVAVTPVAMISAISAIANGGVLMKPLILEREEPQVIRRVISPQVSEAISKMMVSAVEKNYIAAIPNYSIAGKTGTAFVPDFKNGGYTDDVINTYIGFAPAYDPKFIILVRLDRPYGGPLAGLTIVPTFKDMAQYMINYYNIAPDRIDIE